MTDKAKAQGEERNAIPKDDTNDASGVSRGKSLHEDKVPLFDTRGFQWVVAIMLILVTVILSGSILLVVVAALVDGGSHWDTAFFTVLIGLFGLLISGLFVFMAFRIDRGARWEAQRVAGEVAQDVAGKAAREARSTARKRAGRVAAKKAEEVATEKAEEVAAEKAEKTASAVTKQMFEKLARNWDEEHP